MAYKKSVKIHPVLAGRFAHNLLALRTKRGLTHEEFAPRAKISIGYVSLLESQQRTPSLEIVERCAAALKVDPSELLKEVKS